MNGREFVRLIVADAEGKAFDIEPHNFGQCPIFGDGSGPAGLLKQFVSNELGQATDEQRAPKHIEYMRRHDLLDYCDASEKGHFKWYPKGLLIQNLLLDYAAELSREWGAFEMRNPMVLRGDQNVVGELMGEFHERDYRVDGGRDVCYLRYASDPLAFPFMQKVRFNRAQSPLKVYEEANCFRNEQQGEVSGLKRVRHFMMTDMHAACADVEQAKREFRHLCIEFAGLMDRLIARGRWVLGWEGTVAFYEENSDWLLGIGREIGIPAFFKLMPEMSHYYAIKNEYQVIAEDGSNVQISTVQWDVKDGERFDIGFIDEDGQKHACPVIIHASSFGSVERALCAILESIAVDEAGGRPAMLPLWLSPTQVRIVPVSDAHVPAALGLCREISGRNVRVDVDDRDDTVGKKVRNAEMAWVPYVAAVGQKEQESGLLSVRARADGGQSELSAAELAELVRGQVKGMPFRPVPLPVLLSARPEFLG